MFLKCLFGWSGNEVTVQTIGIWKGGIVYWNNL